MALLAAGGVRGVAVPHDQLAWKVRAVMLGRLDLAEQGEGLAGGGSTVKILGGEAWVQCARETARRLADAVGEEAWAQLELSMCGHWGWVYRDSDIPNRHGHCNSCPNSTLARSFKSFNLGADAW